MSQFFRIHPDNPQIHLLRETARILSNNGVIVIPTDSSYALACAMNSKKAMDKIRLIRRLSNKHLFTLMCRDLSELSQYSQVSNKVFRLLKAYTPGPYTFILKATRQAPRILHHPSRKTIGLRIPGHPITQAILEACEGPLQTTSLIMPGANVPLIEPEAIQDVLGKRVDLIISGNYCGMEQTTVVDLTGEAPQLLRVGKGDPTPFF